MAAPQSHTSWLGEVAARHPTYGRFTAKTTSDVAPGVSSEPFTRSDSHCRPDPVGRHGASRGPVNTSRYSENKTPCNKVSACGRLQDCRMYAPIASWGEQEPSSRVACVQPATPLIRENGLPLPTIPERLSVSTILTHGSRNASVSNQHPLAHISNGTAATKFSHLSDKQGHLPDWRHTPLQNQTVDDSTHLAADVTLQCGIPGQPVTAWGPDVSASRVATARLRGPGVGLQEVESTMSGVTRSTQRAPQGGQPLILPTGNVSTNLLNGEDLQRHQVQMQGSSTLQMATQRDPPWTNTVLGGGYGAEFRSRGSKGNEEDGRGPVHIRVSGCALPTIRHVSPTLSESSCKSATCNDHPRPNTPKSPSGIRQTSTSSDACGFDRDGGPSTTSSEEGDSKGGLFDDSHIYSMYDYDRGRERSVSVLGIDLDLQPQYRGEVSRPLTPMYFGFPASKPQRTTSRASLALPIDARPRSVTSSALPVLLPLALATGIVQQDPAAPHLSVYSPTGRLIQAAPSPHPAPASSMRRRVSRASEPMARPAVLPLSTPPQSTVAVPKYVRLTRASGHHHTRSRIVPRSSLSGSEGSSDRTAHMDKLSLRNTPLRDSVMSLCSRNPLNDAQMSSAGPKFRWSAVASCTFLPTRLLCSPKINHLRSGDNKRKSHKPEAPAQPADRKRSDLDTGTLDSAQAARKRSRTGFAPLAAHTLRICFCQPWDGVAGDSAPPARAGKSANKALADVVADVEDRPVMAACVGEGVPRSCT
ncbi:hypothetical protein M011DRAFT_528603 [Sporormia fimetaria CBS 119925]|uniref:Uncharacterized protein n=1 Tax=Sporormia fimetaria CBS 119925 TaxID=1340428 RepID=A0A6A6V0I6_9PLEO|nr:hypothetical protein M011DRAFT_528603 [Sporormia fimetaria CBS 119925]